MAFRSYFFQIYWISIHVINKQIKAWETRGSRLVLSPSWSQFDLQILKSTSKNSLHKFSRSNYNIVVVCHGLTSVHQVRICVTHHNCTAKHWTVETQLQ
jgi:hypothetical protein